MPTFATDVEQIFRQKDPDLANFIQDKSMEVMATLKGPGFTGMITLFSFPLGKIVWGNDVRPTFLLPNGEQDILGHTCHIMIHLDVEDGKENAVAVSQILTRMALALNPMSLSWLPANTFIKDTMFREIVQDFSKADVLPIPLWIQIGAQAIPETDMVAPQTSGLFPYVGFDLVLPPIKAQNMHEVVEFTTRFLDWMIKSPAPFKEGDTMGGSEDDKSLILKKIGEHPGAPILAMVPNADTNAPEPPSSQDQTSQPHAQRQDLTTLATGGNAPLATQNITLQVMCPTGGDVDITLLQTKGGKVRGDGDMCFYGQPSISNGAIKLEDKTAHLDLNQIDSDIDKIFLTATLDGEKAFKDLNGSLSIVVEDKSLPTPCEGRAERALILAEIYRHKGIWKIRNISQGFNGGLKALAEHFGVEIDG